MAKLYPEELFADSALHEVSPTDNVLFLGELLQRCWRVVGRGGKVALSQNVLFHPSD